jgi:hypothetical protein
MTLEIELSPPLGDERLPERFWLKVQTGPEGCWLWTAGINTDGYGIFAHEISQLAHRVSYALLVGPIPNGHDVDHLCRVRHCVNPSHLRAVTHRENILAPHCQGSSAIRARQTHCPNGHELKDPNIPRAEKRIGQRKCRACDWARAHVKRQAALGIEVDLKSYADECYARILAGGPVGRHGRTERP